jgi:hypothetical protein
MMDEKWIDMMVERFEAAFLVTGLKPVSAEFGDGVETGCALMAYVRVDNRGEDLAEANVYTYAWTALFRDGCNLRLSTGWWRCFALGVMDAFDGCEDEGVQESYRMGVEVGRRLRARMFSKTPVEASCVESVAV